MARDRLFDSWVGESGMSGRVLLDRSGSHIFGSMFSFLLGVEGRGGGDIRRIGDPKREGDVAFDGDVPLEGDIAKWPLLGLGWLVGV